MYWTEYQNIDWASMVDSATNFDTANHEVLEYIMVGGATWNKVEFEKKQSFYEFTYTADDDFYTLLLTLGFQRQGFSTAAFATEGYTVLRNRSTRLWLWRRAAGYWGRLQRRSCRKHRRVADRNAPP